MRTSVTGNCSGRSASAAERGFSLLELLVVMAIIGIFIGAVVLSLGTLGNDRQIQEETDRLRSMLDFLHEESLMQSRDFGIMFTETAYKFYVYDYQALVWIEPTDDRLLQARTLNPQLSLALLLDGRDVPLERDFEAQEIDNPEPQVLLLSSGEVTPFTLEITRDNVPGRFEIAADLDGTIEVKQEGFDGV